MIRLVAINIIIPAQVFKFTGQTKVDTYLIDLDSLLDEQRIYDEVMINKVRLAFEAIWFYADSQEERSAFLETEYELSEDG